MHEAVWIDDDTLVCDGTTFVSSTKRNSRFQSRVDEFCLVKNPTLVDSYLALIRDLRPKRIVEIGVLEGGSTALLALAAQPELLVSLERSPDLIEPLQSLIEARGLADRVHPKFGIDQSDSDAVRTEVLEHLGDQKLDLIIDDASHLVEPTRSSFNVLSPLLRPGGMFIIEDWSWAHVGFGTHLPDEEPLTTVVFELVMALPTRPGLISSIRIDRDLAIIERGDLGLDGEFDLGDYYTDRGRKLVSTLNQSD